MKDKARVEEEFISQSDSELQEILLKSKPIIKVIGVGGAGNNTINRLYEIGITDAELVAVNTDAQDLLKVRADTKVLIGKSTSKGLGAGANPAIGKEAAEEGKTEIKKALKDANVVFVTCGLGGGTGTGAIPVIARIAKEQGVLCTAVVTLPFSMEGKCRMRNAYDGFEKLREHVDSIIVIGNDKLLDVAPTMPLNKAFELADMVLANTIKGIVELVTLPGLVNLDFADLKAIMENSGFALIGLGKSSSNKRAVECADEAINNPLLEVDVTKATGALINIAGGSDMTLDEAKQVVERVTGKLSQDAKIIWGARVDNSLEKQIHLTLILTGVDNVIPSLDTFNTKKAKKLEEDMGIEFITD